MMSRTDKHTDARTQHLDNLVSGRSRKPGVLLFLDKEKFSVRKNSIFGIMSWSPRLTRNLVEKIKWICRRAVIIMCPAGLSFLELKGRNWNFVVLMTDLIY